MITSTSNPKIKWVRALNARARTRQSERAFVVEGVRLVEEAYQAGWEAHLVLYTEGLNERGRKLTAAYTDRSVLVELVSPEVMASASDTHTPQGLLAVLPMQELPIPETADFVFIPDAVRDPGNLGAMLRTCAAAGVSAAFIPPETVDQFSPKVLRAAMGAHFRLPVFDLSWGEIRIRLEESGLQVYLAAASTGVVYTEANFRAPLALIVGSEAAGAGQTARETADTRVHIPLPGGMESLNAAAAAAILLFEVVRQRNNDQPGNSHD